MEILQDESVNVGEVHVTPVFTGHVVSLTRERFVFAGNDVVRDVVRHPGAVGVVALRSGQHGAEILLVRQYRHPVSAYLWEIPAGLRDVADESDEQCARRELREETGYDAESMTRLLTCVPSPGGCDEQIVIFVTQNPIALDVVERTDEPEEQDMRAQWWPLADAVAAARDGRIRNLAAVASIFAAAIQVWDGELHPPQQIGLTP
ncbi:MAG: NUDIX hydrolase [Actinobacteria bacterium]|nr:NUDIX hydrolase [Actinomycetota bacterium]